MQNLEVSSATSIYNTASINHVSCLAHAQEHDNACLNAAIHCLCSSAHQPTPVAKLSYRKARLPVNHVEHRLKALDVPSQLATTKRLSAGSLYLYTGLIGTMLSS